MFEGNQGFPPSLRPQTPPFYKGITPFIFCVYFYVALVSRFLHISHSFYQINTVDIDNRVVLNMFEGNKGFPRSLRPQTPPFDKWIPPFIHFLLLRLFSLDRFTHFIYFLPDKHIGNWQSSCFEYVFLIVKHRRMFLRVVRLHFEFIYYIRINE